MPMWFVVKYRKNKKGEISMITYNDIKHNEKEEWVLGFSC